jgi:hypothetical protein
MNQHLWWGILISQSQLTILTITFNNYFLSSFSRLAVKNRFITGWFTTERIELGKAKLQPVVYPKIYHFL